MRKILDSKSLIDKVLSGTQRKTPTVIHKRFPIEGIRKFYIRKIKFVQQSFIIQISSIIDSFPSIDYIHPFFGDLLNIMFLRQHFKLALSRISKSKRIIDITGKNFIKLVKNENSPYICKQLKKEALGRICTIIQKINKSLIFLEKIRKHLDKLPELDPHRKTVILSGPSKVGKSSFLNKTTRANTKVGSFNKSGNFILVGHMHTKYSRIQILDVSGLFLPTINNRNSLAWQMYNAFLNLDSILLHFFDFSECFSISASNQIEVFKNIEKINSNVQKLIAFTKTDLGWERSLDKKKKAGINFLIKKTKFCGRILKTSFHDEIGMYSIKQEICKIIFKSIPDYRVYNKKKNEFPKSLSRYQIQTNKTLKNIFKNSESTQSKFSLPSFNLYQLNILNTKNKKIKKTIDKKYERDQKNREIKIEKYFVKNKIKKIGSIFKKYENFVYLNKYVPILTRLIRFPKKKIPLLKIY